MEPEQQLSSEQKFEGRILRLRVDTVLLQNGERSTREVVDHANAVVIVPVDSDDNVLLVRQYRYPVEETLLEAPAGIIEDSEEPDNAAQRELQEETGYAAKSMRLLGGFWSSPGFCTEYMYAYLARDLVASQLSPDDDEFIELVRRPISRIPQLIRLGEIQDAKTIAALLMATCLFDL